MRTLTTTQQTALDSPRYRVNARVWVEDSAGTLKNLSALGGADWLQEIEWDEDIDQPVSQVTVRLWRESGTQSLAPLRETSPLNQTSTGVYAVLLEAGRELRVDVATTASGVAPLSSEWATVFHGEIDEVDWGGSAPRITLVARDLGGRLLDRFIEEERTYGTADGVAVETVMQKILDDNLAGETRVVLYSPAGTTTVPFAAQDSPGWKIKEFKQEKESLLEALRKLAQQIGWDVRYRFHGPTARFRLVFFAPERTDGAVLYTFHPSRYLDVASLRTTRAGVRNVVKVVYTDPADGKRKTVVASDAASISRYGRRVMELEEGASSLIDTAAEAQLLADSALSDLSDPKAEQEIELLFFWAAEVGDLYTFAANGVHYDTDQTLAAVGVRHTLSPEKQRTTIRVRGRVAGAYREWLRREIRVSGTAEAPPGSPILTPRSLLALDRTAADLYVRLDSDTGEFARLHLRDDDGSAQWSLVQSGTDATALYVSPGTELGPDAWFHNGAAFARKLATIPLYRDQVRRVSLQGEAMNSGLRSTWIPFALDMREQPWLESVDLVWNSATGQLKATAVPGAFCRSLRFDVADDAAFANLTAPTEGAAHAAADGVAITVTVPLATASRGKTWYLRVRPFNGPLAAGVPTGSPGADARDSEFASVDVNTQYAQCAAKVTASDADTVTMQVSGGTQVQLVGVAGSATLRSGLAAGTPGATPQTYVFNRGPALGGSGQAQFRATQAGYVSDDDYVEIAEKGRDTVALSMRAAVLSSTPTQVVVRVHTIDPYPQGAGTITVAYSAAGTGTVTPAGPVTVTSASSFSDATAGTFADVTVLRSAVGTGAGRLVITASAPGRTPDSDAVDVPAQEKASFGPSLTVTPVPGATSYSITWSGDAVSLSVDGAVYGAPPASPFTVARAAPGGATRVYTFRAEKDGQIVSNTVEIPAQATVPAAFPPVITLVETSNTRTAEGVQISVALGSGATGTLQYRTRINTDAQAQVAWGAWTAYTVPVSLTLTRHLRDPKFLQVEATDGTRTAWEEWWVAPRLSGLGDNGRVLPNEPYDGVGNTPAEGIEGRRRVDTFYASDSHLREVTTVADPQVGTGIRNLKDAARRSQEGLSTSYAIAVNAPLARMQPSLPDVNASTGRVSQVSGLAAETVAAGSLRASVALNADNHLTTAVAPAALIAGRAATAVRDEARAGREGIGTYGDNLVRNGGGQEGNLGDYPPGWNYGANWTFGLHETSDAKFGNRVLRFQHDTPLNAYHSQNFAANAGDIFELTAWLRVTAIGAAGGALVLNPDVTAGSLVALEYDAPFSDPSGMAFGLPIDVLRPWTYVRALFKVTHSCTLYLYAQLGYSGQSWAHCELDGITLRKSFTHAHEGRRRLDTISLADGSLLGPVTIDDTSAWGTFRSLRDGTRRSQQGLMDGSFAIAVNAPLARVKPVLPDVSAASGYIATLAGRDAATLRDEAVLGRVSAGEHPENILGNGGGQTDAITNTPYGAMATGWTRYSDGFSLTTYNAHGAKFGDRCLAVAQQQNYTSGGIQTLWLEVGQFYEVFGWIKVVSVTHTSGHALVLVGNAEVHSCEGPATGSNWAGVPCTGAIDWMPVRVVFRATQSQVNVFLLQGYTTGAWAVSLYDGFVVKKLGMAGTRSMMHLTAGGLNRDSNVGDLIPAWQAERAAQGAVFRETFRTLPRVGVEWLGRSGTANWNVHGDDTRSGGNYWRLSGYQWLVSSLLMPFDPSRLYRMRVRLRQVQGPSSGGSEVYLGFEGVANDGATLVNAGGANDWSSQHYFCASGVTMQPSGAYTEFVGYVRGHGSPAANAWDPRRPSALHPSVRYFRPVVIVNYFGGNGTLDIDEITIDTIDEVATRRTGLAGQQWQTIDGGGFSMTSYDPEPYSYAGVVVEWAGQSYKNGGEVITVPNGSQRVFDRARRFAYYDGNTGLVVLTTSPGDAMDDNRMPLGSIIPAADVNNGGYTPPTPGGGGGGTTRLVEEPV